MSAKGILVTTFTGDGTAGLSLAGFAGYNYGFTFTGNFSTGSVQINAGLDSSIVAAIRQLDSSGVFDLIDPVTAPGSFAYDMPADYVQFVLTGSGSPTIAVRIFPPGRL